AHAMNQALGNIGQTVKLLAPVAVNANDQGASLRDLASDLQAGRVDTLIVIGSNPVYTAPADLQFLNAYKHAKLRIHLGLYADETALWSQWHLPETHYLEAWSDGRAYDGTTTIMQPLIAPLYDSAHSAHELLAVFLNQPN